jgi:hypothetical protein
MMEAGVMLKAASSVANGFAGFAAGNYNASVARANGAQAQIDTAQEENLMRAQYRAGIGNQIAAQGASGLAMGTGSMLDTLNESRVNETLSALMLERRSRAVAQGYEQQAKLAKRNGAQALVAGVVNAAGGVLDSKIDYANQSKAFGYGNGNYDAPALRQEGYAAQGPLLDPGSFLSNPMGVKTYNPILFESGG